MKKEAKKSFAKFVNSLFAFVLVVGLMPTWALSNPTPAFAAPNDVTVTTTVDGLASDTLPVLSSAAGDFTVGQAVNADPVNYTDANGNTPVANLAKQQAEKGLSLKWVDAETGADFDWNSTKVNRSTVVNGIWTQTQCSVTVSANDGGKTADTVVTVPWGKSYASVEGSAPQTPSRDGWQFLGWYTSDGQQYNFNSAVKESVVVEAKWAVADVTIVPTTNPTSDVPQSISGTCWIGATWSLHPAQFALSNFTGYLSGCTATGSCADRSAAQPTNVRANYTATLNSVNVETGEVVYDVYITPPGVTDGHSRNQFGLIGYQHVSAQVKLIKNFGGWVEINKSSANTGITDGNGCYSLEGAEYVVYNSDNQAVDKLTTDANGYAKSKLLPSGTYTVKELKAPNGYALDEDSHGIEIKSGQTTTANLKDQPQNDPAAMLLGKYDGEKTYNGEKNLPLGSASLYGAQYSIEYYDGLYDTAEEAEASGDPSRKWVMQTNENSYVNLAYGDGTFDVHDADGNVTATLPYKVSGDDFYRSFDGIITLPLGTIVIKEIKAPKGYNLPQPFGMDQTYVRKITSDTSITEVVKSYNAPEQAEPVFRSDLEFTKAASDDAHSLANVPFKITSKTTGESHVIVTDENGKASTKASWNKHTENTNGNDWVMTENADGVQGFIAKLLDTGKTLDSTSGVWFGQYQDGDETKITDPDDERGALPYDEYTLEELPCAANDGYQLIKKDFTVSRDNTFNADNTINLGTLTDQDISISTQASDKADGDQEVVAEPDVTIVDKVSCDNLSKGTEYIINGTLMDKTTGKAYVDASGNEIHGSTTFTAKSQEQDVFVEFNFDGSNLTDSTDLVVFETIAATEAPDRILDTHEDLDDHGQTITVKPPAIGTIATDGVDNDKDVVKDTQVTVKDTVAYVGLTVGKEYTLKGELMDKATGTVITDADGNPVTAETKFTPNTTAGTVDIEFNFDGSNLKDGDTLVAFEHVVYKDKQIASHTEIGDIAQSVTVSEPKLGTTAVDAVDGDKNIVKDPEASVVDAVQYKDLVPGKEYTVSGTLMVKETGEALLDADGNPVTGSTTFTPEKSEGSVDVVFEFDADLLAGKKLVAFEKLLRNDIEITFHEDIDDEDQTVEVVPPEVGTTATDTADGDKHMSADPESSITDEIAYKNLIPGDEYQVAGFLMDKSTGLPLLSGEGASAISTEDLQKFADDLKAACGLGSGDVSAIEIDGKAFGEGSEVTASNGSYSYTDTDGVQHVLAKSDDGWKLSEVKDSSTTEVATYTDDQVKLTKDAAALPLSPDYEAIAKVMQENPDIVSCLSIQKKTFTPEEQSGTVSMDFPINSIYNEDTDTVVFEFLFKGSELIANESDLGNEGQTVSIVTPKLSTTATDKTDGDHTLLPSREATVIDHVEYIDLIPGKEYTVSGTLMDKSTGEPLVVGDGNVTAETTFVPNKADGTVDLEFTFDASELGGKDLVAFEIAYKNGIQIADHQDIDDEAQTVTVSEPDDNTFDTPGGDGYSKTGVDMTLIYALIAALVALAGGAGAYAYRHRKLAAAEGKTDGESDEE